MSKQQATIQDIQKLMREMGMSQQDVEQLEEFAKKQQPRPTLEDEKAEVLKTVQHFVDTVVKVNHLSDKAINDRFPYPVDITVEWRKNSLVFTKHLLNPTAEEGSEKRYFHYDYAKLTRVGKSSFNAAYMRHTGTYFMLYRNLSLKDCLDAFKNDELLFP